MRGYSVAGEGQEGKCMLRCSRRAGPGRSWRAGITRQAGRRGREPEPGPAPGAEFALRPRPRAAPPYGRLARACAAVTQGRWAAAVPPFLCTLPAPSLCAQGDYLHLPTRAIPGPLSHTASSSRPRQWCCLFPEGACG